jgi:hypothetical protein
LPQASRLQVTTALRQLDQLDLELDPLERWLRAFARRQPGCRALIDRHDGIGMPIAPTILAELGDARRFGNGDAVVRHTGLDVTVPSSDHKPSPGHLSRQGPQVLGWALFEAAHRIRPPDLPRPRPLHPGQTRVDGNRAALTVARKLARRVRHTLIGLGDAALAPVPDLPCPCRWPPDRHNRRCVPTTAQMCRGPRPPRACRHGLAAGGRQRLRGRARPIPNPASCRRIRPLAGPSTQIRMGAGTHHLPRPAAGEVVRCPDPPHQPLTWRLRTDKARTRGDCGAVPRGRGSEDANPALGPRPSVNHGAGRVAAVALSR